MAMFRDKVVVVTGASEGIGRALCLELAPQRPKLVLAARNELRLHEAAGRCRELGAQTLIVPTLYLPPEKSRCTGEERKTKRREIARTREQLAAVARLCGDAPMVKARRLDRPDGER